MQIEEVELVEVEIVEVTETEVTILDVEEWEAVIEEPAEQPALEPGDDEDDT